MTALNHGGVCVSYKCAWKYLRQLTLEARYQELIQSRHQMWVYDNINAQQRIRHEREGIRIIKYIQSLYTRVYLTTDQHAHMLNVTSRLAVNIRYTQEEQFDWSDDKPQKSMESLFLISC